MKTNKKKNIEKFIPSKEFNNNLGSTAKINEPTSAIFVFVNLLKIKKR